MSEHSKLSEQIETYDAIVIGSGITGGWAAKELTESGLKVLLLERGRPVEHIVDYTTAGLAPWELPYGGKVPREQAERQKVQRGNYLYSTATNHFFADDIDNPYINLSENFQWVRGHQVGGRSLLWGRAAWRFSEQDFASNAEDGIGVDWPIRYQDLAPWYSYVEEFIGVSGEKNNLKQVPDGVFLKPFEFNEPEQYFKSMVEKHFPERNVIMGRVAHLTEVKPVHSNLGRSACQAVRECSRGCRFGAYFSTQSATLPAAMRTGRLSVKTNQLVTKLDYNEITNRVESVQTIDTQSGVAGRYKSRIIFLCASTLATTQILLNSTSSRFPNGLANSSGVLGHYLMDHVIGAGAKAVVPGFENSFYYGRRPSDFAIPRFQNISAETKNKRFKRGYLFSGHIMRSGWQDQAYTSGFGKKLKSTIKSASPWVCWMMGFGESLPQYRNKISLHPHKTDKWGIPQIVVDYKQGSEEEAMLDHMQVTAQEMMVKSGFINTTPFNYQISGSAIHEMGTARMGKDPKSSILNSFNQSHDIPNLFITDGACMPSSACQNPSLTYMALTARACNYAVKEFKKSRI